MNLEIINDEFAKELHSKFKEIRDLVHNQIADTDICSEEEIKLDLEQLRKLTALQTVYCACVSQIETIDEAFDVN